jgi:hypothetical protein
MNFSSTRTSESNFSDSASAAGQSSTPARQIAAPHWNPGAMGLTTSGGEKSGNGVRRGFTTRNLGRRHTRLPCTPASSAPCQRRCGSPRRRSPCKARPAHPVVSAPCRPRRKCRARPERRRPFLAANPIRRPADPVPHVMAERTQGLRHRRARAQGNFALGARAAQHHRDVQFPLISFFANFSNETAVFGNAFKICLSARHQRHAQILRQRDIFAVISRALRPRSPVPKPVFRRDAVFARPMTSSADRKASMRGIQVMPGVLDIFHQRVAKLGAPEQRRHPTGIRRANRLGQLRVTRMAK